MSIPLTVKEGLRRDTDRQRSQACRLRGSWDEPTRFMFAHSDSGRGTGCDVEWKRRNLREGKPENEGAERSEERPNCRIPVPPTALDVHNAYFYRWYFKCLSFAVVADPNHLQCHER